MSSIRKNFCLSLAAISLVTVAGCASKKAPFADVTQRERQKPTQTAAVSTAPVAPVEKIEKTKPVVVVAAPPVEVAPASTEYIQGSIALKVSKNGVVTRDWPQAVAYRTNGNMWSGPTYWPSQNSAFARSEYLDVVMEPGEFLFNILASPFRMIETPPWASIEWSAIGKPHNDEIDTTGLRYLEDKQPAKPAVEQTQSLRVK